jgi:NADH:ubiquinone oxidoreductase subunit D
MGFHAGPQAPAERGILRLEIVLDGINIEETGYRDAVLL